MDAAAAVKDQFVAHCVRQQCVNCFLKALLVLRPTPVLAQLVRLFVDFNSSDCLADNCSRPVGGGMAARIKAAFECVLFGVLLVGVCGWCGKCDALSPWFGFGGGLGFSM